ncbi:MAG: hypothetical protein JKY31_03870 [Rhodobacteraceae bacterium]|nr:hypothetical protein [Paracoccaceae bacterium]
MFIVKETHAAKKDKAVIFCCDRNVVRFAQFVARQIIQAEPTRDFDICITTFDSAVLDDSNIHPEIRVCQIDPSWFSSLITSARIPITSYIRIAFPKIFAGDYKQIVYLDIDVFLRKGQISDLFAAAKPGQAISAVQDGLQWITHRDPKRIEYYKLMGNYGKKYLNAGVLVFDTAACRKLDFSDGVLAKGQEALALKKANPDVSFFHDQTAINGFLSGNWAPLSLRWNWQTMPTAARLIDHFDPYLVHFIGHTKPWLPKTVPYTQKYRQYYKSFFASEFNESLPSREFGGYANKSNPGFWHGLKSELTPRKIKSRLNMVNPLYYTNLRGLIPLIEMKRHLKDVEHSIEAGSPIWPRDVVKKTPK